MSVFTGSVHFFGYEVSFLSSYLNDIDRKVALFLGAAMCSAGRNTSPHFAAEPQYLAVCKANNISCATGANITIALPSHFAYNEREIAWQIELCGGIKMDDFSLNEMLEMQRMLQEQYKDKWKPINPERGKDQLLWMIGEIGEVIDIIKKHGGEAASQDKELRAQLVEEMADVLMYYNDVLLCYGISAEELKQSYISKFEKNMKRW